MRTLIVLCTQLHTQFSFSRSRHQRRVGMRIPTIILSSLRSARLVGMALAVAASVCEAQWFQTNGPYGGDVRALAVSTMIQTTTSHLIVRTLSEAR